MRFESGTSTVYNLIKMLSETELVRLKSEVQALDTLLSTEVDYRRTTVITRKDGSFNLR